MSARPHSIPKPSPYLSLRWKLLIGFTALFMLVFALAFYWFYTFATRTALQRIQDDLVDTIVATANGVDPEGMKGLIADGVARADGLSDDPRYWEQVDWFAQVNQIEPRALAYTFLMGDKPNELIFISSVFAATRPEDAAHFRESWIADNVEANAGGLITTTLQSTGRLGCAASSAGCMLEPYSDDFGSWVSAFTPIKVKSGATVAVLGMDFEANYVTEVQAAIRSTVLWAFLITYGVLFLLVLLLSRTFMRPIVALTEAAGEIAEANYDQGLELLKHSDAVGFLADETTILNDVFELMVNKVYAREQSLVRQVEDLKIEIDEFRRHKEVGEIVDTEFFRDLQTKAANLRARRSGPGPESQSPAPA